nr:UDP-glycosyltransferase 71K1-like [Ipomoea batatas]
MKKAELVFVPSPLVGHIVSIVELAKLLLNRDDRLSITVLLIKHPEDPIANTVVQNVVSADARIRHLTLPEMEPPPEDMIVKSPENYVAAYIKSYRAHAKHAIVNSVLSSDSGESPALAGIVFDLFCSSMVDVANDLGVPSYLFYTSGAGFLGFNLYLPIRERVVGREYSLSDPDSVVSTFASPVPARVMPTFAFVDDGFRSFVEHGKKFRETKGMIINTFAELEPLNTPIMKKAELVFIPAPLVGHIVSIVELAKLLLDRDDRLSITVLVIKQPADPIANTVVQQVVSADARIRCFNLPEMEPPPEEMILKVPENYLSAYIKSHRSHAKHAIVNNVLSSDSGESPALAGIVFDLFCSSMVDVANELGVPSYLFYTSGAGFLGVNLYLVIRERLGGREYTLADADSVVSTFASPVPARVMPTFAFIEMLVMGWKTGFRLLGQLGKERGLAVMG